MSDRDQPQEPDRFDESIDDLGEFRGVVLDGAATVKTVPEPPSTPAQPASAPPVPPAPSDPAEAS